MSSAIHCAACALLCTALLLLPPSTEASDNCYDHQTETYDARFSPTSCIKTCTVTPFFSPDTAILTYVSLIEDAEDTIDIYTPGTHTHTTLARICLVLCVCARAQ